MTNSNEPIEGPWSQNPRARGGGGRGPGGLNAAPIFNAPGVVIWTIGFLVVAALVVWMLPVRLENQVERWGAVKPLLFLAGPKDNGGVFGMILPLFSHMALHANVMHLFFNALWLLAFGAPVARRLGATNSHSGIWPAFLFVSFFAVTGAAGALFYIALNTKAMVILVGASGGVSGLLGGLIRFAFQRPAYFTQGSTGLTPLFDRNVLIWSAIIIVVNIAMAYAGLGVGQATSIAWEAHVGGYLFGLIVFPFFDWLARR